MTTLVDRGPAATKLSTGPASAVRQWLALSGRSIAGGVRDGDLLFSAFTPVVFFVCFYVPLHEMFEFTGESYSQYLLPVIVLQSMLFTAMSAGERAAGDALSGMGTRLRAMPVPALVPMFARMSANITRAVISLAGGLAIGYATGFRFHGDATFVLGFIGIALLFALAMAFGADALGSVAKAREATGQLLLVPQLLLTMVSTGIIPAEGFPDWIQPFARYQPVSQVADALRGLANGAVPGSTVASALAWTVGLLVAFGAVALRLSTKER
ncbi:ABC transporter permease [Aldersonia sp. NBC_00410]|uniref:ABC transporter permease n=1 Tax=Aldersonia sp. NBC_00410 TaxID=2975954 RepID=UPI0022587168|nr:ABC transporter permease [Aldersonia sp. NBC_00410]MCX5043516.1 ABC transporter permease [Aldersonia sp. NBC_00410]